MISPQRLTYVQKCARVPFLRVLTLNGVDMIGNKPQNNITRGKAFRQFNIDLDNSPRIFKIDKY